MTLFANAFLSMRHLEALAQDLRYAARGLRRAPGFAAATLVTIALGSGATAAVFAVVNAVLLRPLPYPEASRIALVWAIDPAGARTWLSPPELDDLQRRSTLLKGVAGLTDLRFVLTGSGAPEELQVIGASPSLFPLLGVSPAAGRLLDAGDDRPNAAPVVVLSHGLWQRRFGGARSVVGSAIVLNGRAYTVAGVLPASFGVLPPSPVFPSRVDAWVALLPHLSSVGRDVRYLHAIARVGDGVAIGTARQELAAIGAAVSRDYPGPYGGRAWSFDLVGMQEDLVRGVRPALLLLFTTVALVLLIACTNVAALLLARGESRRREMAIRAALGAGRSRIARQLLAEGALLALLGGAAGLALAAIAPAAAALPLLSALPRFSEVTIDWRVMAFSLTVALGTAIIFASVPALELSSLRRGGQALTSASLLFSGSRAPRAAGVRRTLAGVEIALASLVLVVALLLAKSFAGMLDVNPGFDPTNTVTLRVSLPPRYARAEEVTRFFDAVLRHAREIPGVQAAAAVTQLPFSGAALGSAFTIPPEGGSGEPIRADADLRGITPDYFKVMRVAIVEGRGLSSADTADTQPVAVVDETMARRLWKDGSAVGRRVRWIRQPDVEIEVVGVVRAVRHRGVEQPPRETVYRPHTQYARGVMFVVARTSQDPAASARPLAASVQAVDPDQPVTDVATLDSLVRRSLAQPGFGAALGAALAALALTMAAIGVYGLFAFAVAQRTREMGVRLALGATASSVIRLVLVEGLIVGAAGLTTGLAGALVAAQWVRGFLPGAAAPDLPIFASAAGVMLAAALAACWLPARRAGRVDPASVLRAE